MTEMDGPLNEQSTEIGRSRAVLWLAGITALAGLLTAVAAVITALKG